MNSYPNVIHERSEIIPIKKNMSTTMKENNKIKQQYSLNKNFFDPSKSSPPNEFMIKLHMRMNSYQKKDDNLDNE